MTRTDQDHRPVERFAALGHPLRYRILAALLEHPGGGAEVARRIGRPPGTVGYHLDVLERAGLVQVIATRRVRALTERIYGPTGVAEEVLAAVRSEPDVAAAPVTPTPAPVTPAPAPVTPAPAPTTPSPRSPEPALAPAPALELPLTAIAGPAVPRPRLELPSGTQAGVLRFIHYAFMPNRLGYCGPDDNRRLFDHGVEGQADRSLIPSLAQFLGPVPYLRAIAAGAGIPDVFDERVVEAYWVGNDLLRTFASHELYQALRERFRKQLPPKVMDLIADKVPEGALPHHSFHVFDVWLRVGKLDGNVVSTVDHCRISWGTVTSVDGSTVGVQRRAIELRAGKLRLAAPEQVYTTRLLDGRGFVTELVPGDLVSLHWGWVCERLSAAQARDLDRYTSHHVRLANQTI